jgi:uncharacterized protein YeaO (DUF488 family)
MAEVRTKSVYYDPVDKKEDGFRVLIMRYWPRGKSTEQVATQCFTAGTISSGINY